MIDFAPVVQPVLEIVGTVAAAVIAAYVPVALAAFQKRTGIVLTSQQQAAVQAAAQNAAGRIETLLDQRALSVAHVSVGDPAIQAEANAVIGYLPEAAAALGVTPETVAAMIVGKVNTAPAAAAAVAAAQPAANAA